METHIIKVPNTEVQLGNFREAAGVARLDEWHINPLAGDAVGALQKAASRLRDSNTPVAFPTETVYGLAADATCSESVRGIYAAKGRPSDNPLIVHVCDLQMLRSLLAGHHEPDTDADAVAGKQDTIPTRYHTLIDRFWPGPLTILLPNPPHSRLAPEVTAGLQSVGVRMPSAPLALSLIKLAGVPLAAPSANASTKPSPTTAQHVKHDLDGRIELILDGGPCAVGVESTVVDGLCDPPVVLRPGGVSLDELRSCPGWEAVIKGYKDESEEGKTAPRAPGMKYKHYSPKAKVILYEAKFEPGSDRILPEDIDFQNELSGGPRREQNAVVAKRLGIIRTQRWQAAAGLEARNWQSAAGLKVNGHDTEAKASHEVLKADLIGQDGQTDGELFDIDLGRDTRGIAQGLFSALRELDSLEVDAIFVDGIDDSLDIAAAVMNRLRKAATKIRS